MGSTYIYICQYVYIYIYPYHIGYPAVTGWGQYSMFGFSGGRHICVSGLSVPCFDLSLRLCS